MFVDYYEVLQISPNADEETVQRVYRVQASRFHPDNQDTGDAEKFRLVAEAFHVLNDPRSRATYDVEYRNARVFMTPAPSPLSEEQKREEILLLLYKKRLSNPEQPSLSLREFETLLEIPKDQLEFSLWYLKESGYLVRTDSARHTITIQGVQLAESLTRRPRIDSSAR
jgi:curved DNA-binding protein CbpA